MTDNTDTTIAEKLKALQISFQEQLPERISNIESCWKLFLEEKTEDTLKKCQLLTHSLAGSAFTFNAEHIGNHARSLEIAVQEFADAKIIPGESECDVLQKHMDTLVRTALSWTPGGIYSSEKYRQDEKAAVRSGNNLVYVVEDDELLSRKLSSELAHKNYEVIYFNKPSDMEKACRETTPAVIIMDVVFNEGELAGVKVLEKLDEDCIVLPPVIFISVRDDINARLAALKTGAVRYFVKPFEMKNLVRAVDNITGREHEEPYRVLVVDDDVVLSEYNCKVLENAAIIATKVNDPLKTLEVMNDFKPDLILLDLYMPGCSGLELAGVIRQDDTWLHTPIVFLSSESDHKKHLSALDYGGDDFIIKPVSPETLVNNLRARLKRSRWMSNMGRELRSSVLESKTLLAAMDKHNIVSISDNRGIITHANEMFCEISGYHRDELIGKDHNILNSGYHPRTFFQDMWATISSGKVWHGEVRNKNKKGGYYWVASTIVPYIDSDDRPYQYVSLRTDITNLVNTRQELLEAKNIAENANRTKSEFLSNMSHELRTPMNAIIGFGQLLEMENETKLTSTQKDNVGEIVKAGKHLLELINDVLDLAKVEAGRVDLSLEANSINDIVSECCALITPLAMQKNVTLLVSCDDEELPVSECHKIDMIVRADRTRLKQVVLNLLSNAIKYNTTGGKAVLSCVEAGNGKIRFSVSDTGLGLDEKQQLRLFEPFVRLEKDKENIEGTGIGLVITKRLVELMGGNIGVTSVKGKGSTFWIELPRDNIQELYPDDAAEGAVAAGGDPDLTESVVLYIEDNPANLLLVSQVFARLPGIKLLTAPDANQGLVILKEHQPNLVLLDINLPDINGYSVLKQIKSTMDIPVFAISANAMRSDIRKGLDAGFDKYLTKPVNVEELIKYVTGVLSNLDGKKARKQMT